MSRTPDSTVALQRVRDLLEQLRGPEGCPWMRAQTHRTLLPYLAEEASELIEAAETGGDEALREELGDVLLQVLLHAQIAAERGAFGMAQVAEGLAHKLERRHPHVFGTPAERAQAPRTAEGVAQAWQARKRAARSSALGDLPPHLPALQQAAQVSARAAQAGFEWNDRGEILAKAAEELEELRAALLAPEDQPPAEDAEAELGDLLFACVQIARWQGLDPEAALRRATRKFSARFRWMESALRARGLHLEAQTSAQWWALWREAKARAE